MRPDRVSAAVLITVTAAACASPSWSAGDYRHKAANTAQAMVSAAATAELAAQTMLDDKAFGPFVNVNVTNAEEDANSIAATFDSVQPPDAASDKLRNAVDTAMQAATSALADLRIAVRRRQLEEVRKALSDLTKARSELQKLETVA